MTTSDNPEDQYSPEREAIARKAGFMKASTNSDALSEDICQHCARTNPVWYAPNDLWNKVMRYPDGKEASELYNFVCPTCFTEIAESVGISIMYELKEAK